MTGAGVGAACLVTPGAMRGDESATKAAITRHPERFFGMARTYRSDAASDRWKPEPVDLHHARADVRELGETAAERRRLCEFAEGVPGVLAVHAEPGQTRVVREIVRARRGRWTLLDHLGRPDLTASDHGLAGVLELAGEPDLALKTPNLGYFSAVGYPFLDLAPVFGRVIHAFGAERLLWGSDWPLSTKWCSYNDQVQAIVDLLGQRGGDQLVRTVLRDNARKVFSQ